MSVIVKFALLSSSALTHSLQSSFEVFWSWQCSAWISTWGSTELKCWGETQVFRMVCWILSPSFFQNRMENKQASKTKPNHPEISSSSKTMIPPAKSYGRNSAREHRRLPQNFIISEYNVQLVLDFLQLHCVLKDFCRGALTWLFFRM